MELLGLTAGETKGPVKVMPRAVNGVIWRILIFYIGALVAVASLVPWNRLSPDISPFVQVFQLVGFPAAAGVINFVVLTAALSSCNSGLYSTGRMLNTPSRDGQAPGALKQLSAHSVPARGILLSFFAMLLGVVLNYLVPEQAFVYITSVSTVSAIFVWAIILVAHLAYRRRVKAGELPRVAFRMPFSPSSNWLVLIFLAFVIVLLGFDADSRIALYAAPVWGAFLTGAYLTIRRRPVAGGESADHESGPTTG
ncbi:amino acid permease [Streptomyces decoyicus]|uniref:amino acid permease n=1 Tax=Streptomyces decoyicus TaxID=249567 RepID=UPI0033FD920F